MLLSQDQEFLIANVEHQVAENPAQAYNMTVHQAGPPLLPVPIEILRYNELWTICSKGPPQL